jgi:cytochrome P450
LRTILLHVITNHTICAALLAEIDSGVRGGKISSPIKDEEARKMPYLQACIKEGFRYWPPVTGLLPRISQSDETVCGVHIPAGTDIAWSAWAVMRNKEMFGPDSAVYRPERWLNVEPARLMVMDNTVGLCFGQGRWGCLGRPIAQIELNKMIVEVRSFLQP